jgi:glycosyltransferase involved in cell wall biosynthesis
MAIEKVQGASGRLRSYSRIPRKGLFVWSQACGDRHNSEYGQCPFEKPYIASRIGAIARHRARILLWSVVAATIRLLAIIEASTITGPAKNLLQFAELARSSPGGPAVEVHAVVFQRPDAPTLFLDTARTASLPVHVIPESGRFDSAVLPALVGVVRDLAPDLVQSHAVKSHFVVRKAGVHRLRPWIAFHHGYTTPDLRARLYNQLDRWSLRDASQVVTVSRPFRDELVRKGVSPERIEIVHNAIRRDWGASGRDAAAASALRARWGIDREARVILLVGRFSREKDHLTLLEAAARLRAGGVPKAHLVLVGDGPERARIEHAIAALGLSGAVTLTGQVPSAEPFYGIADAAVLSSLSEGSPNALLEAMAVGVPVVATKVGGIPEIVSHGESALLIAPGDRDGMAAALEKVLADGAFATRLAAEARRIIETRHTPEMRMEQLVAIYRKVAAKGQIR